VTLVETVGVG
jgi:LAO/AO transport system kinase